MKKKYLLILFSITPLISFCQEKLSIAILPFQFNSNVNPEDANAISLKVESAFINSKRFTVIERTNFEQVFKELDSQKNDIYINSSRLAKQGGLIGASQIVVGNVSSTGPNGTTFNFKVVDVETGQTIGSKTVSDLSNSKTVGAISGLFDSFLNSTKDIALKEVATNAIGGALLNINKEVLNFINETYGLTYEILEITKIKEQNAIELMIVGGVNEGLKSSIELEVILETTKISGTRKFHQKSVIGKLRVNRVEGEVTICKVNSGGKEIKEMFVPTNKIYASTITKK